MKSLVKRGWVMLLMPPLTLLLITMLFAVGWGIIGGGDSAIIQEGVESSVAAILFINHITLFLLLLNFLKRDNLSLKDIGWSVDRSGLAIEVVIGILFGLLLYAYNEWALEPVQQLIDGRPLNFSIPFVFRESINWSFLIAGTTLPFVEESIYRGYALKAWENKYSTLSIIAISSICFGFLHWGQGVSGIIATATFAPIFFGMYVWRKNLIAVTIGHMLYNGIVLCFI